MFKNCSRKKQFDEIKKVLTEGVDKKHVTKEFAKLMLPEKPKSGSIYLLPKVHKKLTKYLNQDLLFLIWLQHRASQSRGFVTNL